MYSPYEVLSSSKPLSYTVSLRSTSMSSNVAIFLEPTTVKRRSLCGSSHDRCRCAASPEGKRRKQKTTSSTPGSHVRLALGADLVRLLARQAQQHRHVVGAQAPERVLLGAQLAQVQAVAVDVVDVAQLAVGGQAVQHLQPGVVLQEVTDHQDPVRLGGRRHHALGVGHGLGQRLLDEAVLARGQHPLGDRRVGGHRRGHRHRVQGGIGQQLVQVGALARVGERQPLALAPVGRRRRRARPARRRAGGRSCGPGWGPSSPARPPRPSRDPRSKPHHVRRLDAARDPAQVHHRRRAGHDRRHVQARSGRSR